MHWGQITLAVTASISLGYFLFRRGSDVTTSIAAAVVLYFSIRWVLAWLFRVRYWLYRGTKGHYSTTCDGCGQYIYRQRGDWILRCKRCGWAPGFIGLRWFTQSVPARQLRRTVVGPQLLIVVFAVFLLVGGSAVGVVSDDSNSTPTPTEPGPDRFSSPTSPVEVSPSGMSPTNTRTPTSTPVPDNPWGKKEISVGVRNRAASDRNITDAVAAALDYWRPRDEEFGAYSVNFSLEPDATSPDIVVWYNHTIDCETVSAAGCAPQLNESYPPDPPEKVQIKYNRTDNYRETRNTVIHEFGHVIGIGHCDEPAWIMNHQDYCLDSRTAISEANEREFAWRDRNLTYSVDVTDVSEQSRTLRQVQHAIDYFENGSAGTVPDDVTLSRVDPGWGADISIRFGDCEEGISACPWTWGRDPDSDGQFNFHTQTVITVDEDDVSARGWYVGWALSRSLSPGDIPALFENATFEERRSEWWQNDD